MLFMVNAKQQLLQPSLSTCFRNASGKSEDTKTQLKPDFVLRRGMCSLSASIFIISLGPPILSIDFFMIDITYRKMHCLLVPGAVLCEHDMGTIM